MRSDGVFLVTNASNILLPLDAAPFGGLHRLLRVTNDQYVLDALLTGGSTRESLLAAAFHCERRNFTPAANKGAFEVTRLCPFKPKVVLARAFENLGVAPAGASVREGAQAMAAEVDWCREGEGGCGQWKCGWGLGGGVAWYHSLPLPPR